MPKTTKAAAKKVKTTGREVMYPEMVVEMRVIPKKVGTDGHTMRDGRGLPVYDIDLKELAEPGQGYVITPALAMELLGWQYATEENLHDKSLPEPLFTDLTKSPVRCLRNIGNRPLDLKNVERLKQEVLNRHWEFNFEPIIINRYGELYNGQHTLIALVLADQERRIGRTAERWNELWSDVLTQLPKDKQFLFIEKMICYGADPDKKVFDTMDTGKPRSIADAIFTSGMFRKKYGLQELKTLASNCDWAIKFLWARTGYSNDAFAPNRTHREAINFLEHHKKLIDCVEFITDLDRGNKKENVPGGRVRKILHPGFAAGVMYLMATTNSNEENYHKKREKGEDVGDKQLKFDLMKKAEEFWSQVTTPKEAGGDYADSIVDYIAIDMLKPDGRGPSNELRVSCLAKAWNMLSEGVDPSDIDKEDIIVDTKESPSGREVLNEFPTFGGIDLGYIKPDKQTKGGSDDEDEESLEEAEDTDPMASDDLEDEFEEEEVEEEEVEEVKPKKRGKKKVEEDEDDEEDVVASFKSNSRKK